MVVKSLTRVFSIVYIERIGRRPVVVYRLTQVAATELLSPLTSVAQVMRVSWGMMSEDTSYTAAAAAAAVSAVATDGRLLPPLCRSRPARQLTGRPAREDDESRSDQTDCGAAIAMA